MNKDEIFRVLGRVGAVITGSHVVYTSWRHGTDYVDKDALYPYTRETSQLCLEIAEEFARDAVEVVIAPEVGGVILSQWVAHHLTQIGGSQVFSVYAKKVSNGDTFEIRPGYAKFVRGRNVLVVEDSLTTGGTARKVVEATRICGGIVVGVAALCNRGGVTSSDLGDIPKLFSLVDVQMDSWEEAECLPCRRGIPVNVEIGKGREYLLRKHMQ